MEGESLPLVQIAVVHAEGNIRSSVRCELCDQIPEPGQAVLRVRDFKSDAPGVPEYVMCKTCLQALLDVSVDDVEVMQSRFEAYQAELVARYAAN